MTKRDTLMSEQDRTHVSTKPRRSRPASTQKTTLQRPANDDKEAWKAYWKEQGQPWRTEPEISKERQKYLAERRKIKTDFQQCIYPFKDIRLERADIEWLLSTHENNRGPIDWNDESQREREGLDLRGADLSNEDLSHLPLAKLCCGVDFYEALEPFRTEEPDKVTDTKIVITRNHLFEAQLQGTSFAFAQLQGANLCWTQLQKARFLFTQLQGANLSGAQLQGAFFYSAQLQGADLSGAHLQEAFLLEDTQLQGADLSEAELQGASLIGAQLRGANLRKAQLQNADLSEAQLQGVNLKD